MMEIRTAKLSDLDAIAALERECFPAAEAATREEFEERLRHYANHFYLGFVGGRLVSFVDGFATNAPDLTDEMYENAALHNEGGAWQMIFGVLTAPDCRGQGHAGELLRFAIETARKEGRRGVVLTCKEKLIAYYASFGFQNEGVSKSVHGNTVWYQMRITF